MRRLSKLWGREVKTLGAGTNIADFAALICAIAARLHDGE